MSNDRAELLLIGPPKPTIVNGLAPFTVHRLGEAKDRDALLKEVGGRVRGIASSVTAERIDGALMAKLPKLEIVSTFGVGYDHIDIQWAASHGVTVTNTPQVLTEEVADTALGLLLCTVREFPQAERYLRAGKWTERAYPLTKATLRNRTVGMVGMGAIGQAIARRLEAMKVPVVYHSRRPAAGVSYRHYPKLLDMARDVTVLLVITPGGTETKNLINAEVLQALKDKTILSAGLDVYLREPEVPAELIAMDNIVLFPHLGSASVHTRTQMDQLVVDNLLAWAAGEPPLTPVPETPWRPGKTP